MNVLTIALAAIELLAPGDGAVVKLVPDVQRAVMAKESLAGRKTLIASDGVKYGTNAAWRCSEPVVFRWRPTGGEIYMWEFSIAKRKDFSDARVEVLTAETNADGCVEWMLPRANLEVGATYYWRVSANLVCFTWGHPRGCGCPKARPIVTSRTRSFHTEDLAPRWIEVEGRVKNIRDIGGRRTEDGRRVRQGLVFRGQGLNDNSLDGFVRGRNRLTAEDVAYLAGTLGIRTDLDLRTPQETALMKVSPLGPSVHLILNSSCQYKEMFTPEGRRNVAENFRVFTRRENFPVYFHCIAGADRTGSLAYILESVLGVSRHDCETDWESTFYPRFPKESDGILGEVHFSNGLAAYGKKGDSLRRRAELYLMDCGITKEEIEAFRSIMLE